VIKSIDPSTGKLVNEVPLVLSRRNVRIYGVSELWDSITAESAINNATDEEVCSVTALKDSFIISVKSGKVSNTIRSPCSLSYVLLINFIRHCNGQSLVDKML
jgi:hypothetical protein